MTQTAEQQYPIDAPGPDAPRKLPRWRRVLVAVLVVIGCVLAPISVLGVWIDNTLLDTDQYVETVGPLIDNRDVQEALATRITNALIADDDVEERIADALPAQASFVAPAVSNALEQFVNRTALDIVQSDAVETLWDGANRRAHTQIVALLEGSSESDRVSTENGEVVVRLGPLVGKVRDALEDRGIDIFDSGSASRVNPEIVLIQSDALETAQDVTDLLQKLAYILPILTVLVFAAAIWLSGNRRRTILRGALGVALAMGLLLVVFNAGRHFYLDALPPEVNQGAAGAVYDQILSFLRLSLRTAFVVALIVAFAAWIAGPSPVATKIRNATIGRARDHEGSGEPSAISVFFGEHKNALRVVVIAIALAILAVLDAPTPAAVLVLAILVVVALLLIELLATKKDSVKTL